MDTDKTGGRNPIMDAAMEIDIFRGTGRQADAIRGEKVADNYQDDPRLQLAPVAADPEAGVEASNPAGSYEAMLQRLGGGMRPAMDTSVTVNGSG